ncbi:MAG: ATP-binding cassette domain-containing protein [Verrucomicrobia bacterium]|jgi:ABC-type lipoprotein export system ATPase subunit|nr:ATP-binding cassette domain-containing protein [Verrucomicrobiota bacterium]
MSKTILTVTDLKKCYGPVEVLHGVDFAVDAGERVALMGPSGSGKSTLLNCLSGIERWEHGQIRIDGFDLGQADRGGLERLRRESIGYIFQAFHLLPTLSAYENVELPGQLIGMSAAERRRRVTELLEAVGLGHRAGHRPDALSGGERQRVALARAVMHRPRLILADEPTGSLDSVAGAQVLNLLKQLSADHGIALLLVTHDPATAEICDRTVHMRDGRIEETP